MTYPDNYIRSCDDANPATTLTYIQQTGDAQANHDAGDRYTGLDRFGRVIDQYWLNTTTGIPTDRYQYTYDLDSNVTNRINLVADATLSSTAMDESFAYDNLNQLTSTAGGTNASQSWTLDPLGNMDTVTTNGTPQARTYNSQNQLQTVGTTTLQFDHNGNTTTDDQGHTLTYDAWNHLISVKSGSTLLKAYTYDPAGRRITETDGSGTTTTLFYSAQWQVLETQQNGSTTAQYVWSPVYVNALICQNQPTTPGGPVNQRIYVVQDANYNTTALLTYNTQTQTWAMALRVAYDAYGNATFYTPSWTPTTNTLAFRVLYQGGWYDPATGLYMFQHRDYSPTAMRWIEQDPMGYVDASNLYLAWGANPNEYLDPNGTQMVFTSPVVEPIIEPPVVSPSPVTPGPFWTPDPIITPPSPSVTLPPPVPVLVRPPSPSPTPTPTPSPQPQPQPSHPSPSPTPSPQRDTGASPNRDSPCLKCRERRGPHNLPYYPDEEVNANYWDHNWSEAIAKRVANEALRAYVIRLYGRGNIGGPSPVRDDLQDGAPPGFAGHEPGFHYTQKYPSVGWKQSVRGFTACRDTADGSTLVNYARLNDQQHMN